MERLRAGGGPVGIVGGGLGGLALAVALERRGVPWRLFERAPSLRSDSEGVIVLFPNGMRALAAVHPDLPNTVAAAGAVCRSLTVVNRPAAGAETRNTDTTYAGYAERHGFPAVLVAWRAVHRAVAALLPRGAGAVRCGHALAGFGDESAGGVTLRFATSEGHVSERVAVAVACDGAFSAARRLLGHRDPPRYFGQMNWSSVVDTAELAAPLTPGLADGMCVRLSCEEPPIDCFFIGCGGGQSFWQVRARDEARQWAVSGSRGRGGLGLTGVRARLLELAAGQPDVAAAIAATPERRIFERSMYDVAPLARWSSALRRVVLLGDAAHAMHAAPGQGANFAFEDAAELVARLDAARDVGAAVAAYEAARIPRATAMQRAAAAAGEVQKQSAVPKGSPEDHRVFMRQLQEQTARLLAWRPGAALPTPARL